MNNKIKIAIIDDGVNTDEFYTPSVGINIEISEKGFVKYINESDIQTNSHGTICAAVLKKYLKYPDIDFISIKILDNETKKGDISQFTAALNWCINNNINIINCSFGTLQYDYCDIIKDIVNKAVGKRIIIISAMNNNNIYSLPACLNNVIGIKNNFLYKNGIFKLRWYPFDDIEILTSGGHELLKKTGVVFNTPISNSYAAPVITATVSDIVFKNGILSYEEILLQLELRAKTVIGSYIPKMFPYIWNIPENKYTEIYNKYDYREYSNIIYKYLKSDVKEIEVPLINFYGINHNICLDFIFLLLKKLELHNFYYRVVTEYISGLKYGFILFPQNYDKINFCKNIYNKFKNDILISHSGNSLNCDINININDMIIINYNDTIQKSMKFEVSNLEESVNFLFEILS